MIRSVRRGVLLAYAVLAWPLWQRPLVPLVGGAAIVAFAGGAGHSADLEKTQI